MYYDTEKPLPNDIEMLSVQVGASKKDVELMLKIYFSLDGDAWTHTRCEEVIAEYHAQKEQQSAAGKASAAKRKRQKMLSDNGGIDNTDSTGVQRSFNERSTGVAQPLYGRSTGVQPTINHKPYVSSRGEVSTDLHSCSDFGDYVLPASFLDMDFADKFELASSMRLDVSVLEDWIRRFGEDGLAMDRLKDLAGRLKCSNTAVFTASLDEGSLDDEKAIERRLKTYLGIPRMDVETGEIFNHAN